MSPDERSAAGGGLFVSLFTTDEVARETSDVAWVRAMLEVETALARACDSCGLFDRDVAEAIAAVCAAEDFDAAELGREARLGGNPVIPLVAWLRRRLGAEAARFAHHGATSQDVLDTALMLVTKRSLALAAADLARAVASAGSLAERHRDTPQVARTLLQPALPTTFGLRAPRGLGCGASRLPRAAGGRRGASSHTARRRGRHARLSRGRRFAGAAGAR